MTPIFALPPDFRILGNRRFTVAGREWTTDADPYALMLHTNLDSGQTLALSLWPPVKSGKRQEVFLILDGIKIGWYEDLDAIPSANLRAMVEAAEVAVVEELRVCREERRQADRDEEADRREALRRADATRS